MLAAVSAMVLAALAGPSPAQVDALIGASARAITAPDGRGHPSDEDLWPTYMGHSIGRWEGDTLVVDTVGMAAGVYDTTNAPHSDQIHLVERIRLISKDRLEVKLTVEDPVMFTRPYTVRRTFSRVVDPKNILLGSYCTDARDSNSAAPHSLVQ